MGCPSGDDHCREIRMLSTPTCCPRGPGWSLTHQQRGDYKSAKCFYVDKNSGKHVYVTAGSGTPSHRDPRQYGSRAEAQAAANGAHGDLSRGKLSAEVEGPGNPNLYAEALIGLSGFDPDVDGDYLAKTVTHTLTKRGGYTTTVHMESAES